VSPLNMLGDFGGGMLLALSVVSAPLHARESGQGQVVDAAILDGTALLSIVLEVPDDMLGAGPEVGVWATVSLRRDSATRDSRATTSRLPGALVRTEETSETEVTIDAELAN
jgi:hypothetical protein